MHQAVIRQLLIAEARVRALASQFGTCGGQSDTREHFSPSSSVSPLNIIPSWFSMLIYHLGDE
jgi:hypothetical protein